MVKRKTHFATLIKSILNLNAKLQENLHFGIFDNHFPSFGSLNPMSESQKRISELDFNEILKCHLFILIGYFGFGLVEFWYK